MLIHKNSSIYLLNHSQKDFFQFDFFMLNLISWAYREQDGVNEGELLSIETSLD